MKRPYLTVFIAITLASSFFMTGCGILRPIIGDRFHDSRQKPRNASHGDKSTLKKKVLVAPMVNLAGFEDERSQALTDTWIAMLEKEESIIITSLTEPEGAFSSTSSGDTGVIIAPALIDRAGEMGMNLLVTLVMEPIYYKADKGIIWPFNKFKGEYDVSMAASALDVTTGTVVFTFRESRTIKMGRVPEGQTTPIELPRVTLDSVLSELQETLSSDMIELLSGLAWRGRIALDGESIRISGGTDIGITEGVLFNVFERGETIRSANGTDYHIDGPVDGEIRVREVGGDYSLAVPVGDKVFEAGQIITPKSE